MRSLFFFLFVVVFIKGSSQTNNQLSWYKRLEGKIDKYPVTLHLHKIGSVYNGYYYYNSRQIPVYFSGEDTTVKGKITLLSYPNVASDNYETFSFTINDNSVKGSWKKSQNSTPLDFSAINNVDDTLIKFYYVYTIGNTKLRSQLKESPEATFEAGTIWPKGSSAKEMFIKKVISESLGEKTTPSETGATLLRNKKKFFSDYLEQNKGVTAAQIKESSPVYTADETTRTLVVFQSSKLLSLGSYSCAYTGGAHGNYGTTYIVFDLLNNKKLNLSDILNNNGKGALNNLLAKYFRKTYGLKETEPLTKGGLFENTIKANNNFYITTTGIGFNYTPYEIAPYVVGEINLFIPFNELNIYLQPTFQTLIQ